MFHIYNQYQFRPTLQKQAYFERIFTVCRNKDGIETLSLVTIPLEIHYSHRNKVSPLFGVIFRVFLL